MASAIFWFLVDLEDPVHVPEVEHQRAAGLGSRPAIPVVLAPADRPHRQLVLVGDPHDRTHLIDGRRLSDGTRKVAGGTRKLERVDEVGKCLRVDSDLVRPKRGGERCKRRMSPVEWWGFGERFGPPCGEPSA
jgi:hypothetical protein